ncbi:hypothetical protein H5410_002419 [Solanum commersonii]|uniref:Non-haem dioxygenase N-terminal domain-containing protein n=1 Tax=Solanum commersonii TaxID=4109 RepID=A0A9J6B1V2_SOLCO|nr:hypothetical protein H5410_002419 [Solanum commersonii]
MILYSLMLVWDNRTSIPLSQQDELMATHDDETANHFQGTQIGTMFTHHQKIVIIDGEMPYGDKERRTIADQESLGRISIAEQKGQLLGMCSTILNRDGESKMIMTHGMFKFFDPLMGDAPEEPVKSGIISGKQNIIDQSIHDAYTNAIHRAKHFIYIENQYFLAAAFHSTKLKQWKSLRFMFWFQCGQKDFLRVHLYKQYWIGKGGPCNANDVYRYNSSSKGRGDYEPAETPEPNSNYHKTQEARRFMIYVHSKMMIGKFNYKYMCLLDDEDIIIERIATSIVITDDSITLIDASNWDDPKVAVQICKAAQNWGFFQIINHGVPIEVLDNIKETSHRFFNLPTNEKKKYTNSLSSTVRYATSFNPEAGKTLSWRDYLSLVYIFDDEAISFWPTSCREEALEYLKSFDTVIRKILKLLMGGLNVKEIDEETEEL